MKKTVIITQRHGTDRHGSLMDSLENAYVTCLSACGFSVIPIPTMTPDPVIFAAAVNATGIILSGGGDIHPAIYGEEQLPGQAISKERDKLEFALLDLAVRDRLPVFGICRGMQTINVYFGGKLDSKVLPAAHTEQGLLARHRVTFDDQQLQERFPLGSEVNSYHRQAVLLDQLGKDLDSFARHAALPLAEGIRHNKLPVAGVQWHPERNSQLQPVDRLLLEAFRDNQLFWGV